MLTAMSGSSCNSISIAPHLQLPVYMAAMSKNGGYRVPHELSVEESRSPATFYKSSLMRHSEATTHCDRSILLHRDPPVFGGETMRLEIYIRMTFEVQIVAEKDISIGTIGQCSGLIVYQCPFINT